MRPMTKTEYRAIIAALGQSQLGAGDFLEIGERMSRRYALLALILIKVHTYRLGPCKLGGAAVVNAVKW
jgi:hypothetical protein